MQPPYLPSNDEWRYGVEIDGVENGKIFIRSREGRGGSDAEHDRGEIDRSCCGVAHDGGRRAY